MGQGNLIDFEMGTRNYELKIKIHVKSLGQTDKGTGHLQVCEQFSLVTLRPASLQFHIFFFIKWTKKETKIKKIKNNNNKQKQTNKQTKKKNNNNRIEVLDIFVEI